VPPVIDRLVHRAMRNTIEPTLEAHAFQDWVSGFRPGRSRITAVNGPTPGRRAPAVDEAVTWHAEHIHDGAFLARLPTALAACPNRSPPALVWHRC
jgi:hypothetical protein